MRRRDVTRCWLVAAPSRWLIAFASKSQECGGHETPRDPGDVWDRFFTPLQLHKEFEMCVHQSYWALYRRDCRKRSLAEPNQNPEGSLTDLRSRLAEPWRGPGEPGESWQEPWQNRAPTTRNFQGETSVRTLAGPQRARERWRNLGETLSAPRRNPGRIRQGPVRQQGLLELRSDPG